MEAFCALGGTAACVPAYVIASLDASLHSGSDPARPPQCDPERNRVPGGASRYVRDATRYVRERTRYVRHAARHVKVAAGYIRDASRYVRNAIRYVSDATRYAERRNQVR